MKWPLKPDEWLRKIDKTEKNVTLRMNLFSDTFASHYSVGRHFPEPTAISIQLIAATVDGNWTAFVQLFPGQERPRRPRQPPPTAWEMWKVIRGLDLRYC